MRNLDYDLEVKFVAERLDAFVHFTGLNRTQFAESIGVHQQALNRMLKERKGFSAKFLLGLCKVYPALNVNWLMRGEGSMLNGPTSGNSFSDAMVRSQQTKELEAKYKKIITTKDTEITRLQNLLDAFVNMSKK